MTACIHCGIPAPFLEKGYVIVKGSGKKAVERAIIPLDDRTSAIPYESIAEALHIVTVLTENSTQSLRLGISEAPVAGRLYEPDVLKKRLEEKDAVEFIQSGSFTSYLQPIVSMKTKELYGYEALLRAENPQNFISPAVLFETAERTGLNSLLDQRAREAAVRARKGTIPEGVKSFINFLPSTIYNPEFCLQHTFAIVDRYGVNPADLVFEVVETERVADVGHLKKVMDRYKREGMKVALDDVGAGFATIEMLHLLQPDYVKIDRSYISGCDTDMEKQQFLKATYSHAKDLGIVTLAEGIETEEEFNVCADIGYDLCQGYLIGKPAPSASEKYKPKTAIEQI